ncbi:MAG TPA: hypothetical protein VJY35_16700 [Candidatus Eisenbacteria bacterium]|nr:hypothetical protein [Candidatus Eisenbacteria bacterium]
MNTLQRVTPKAAVLWMVMLALFVVAGVASASVSRPPEVVPMPTRPILGYWLVEMYDTVCRFLAARVG